MRHTEDEINEAADRFAALAERLEPAEAEADNLEDLRRIATASDAIQAGEAELREAVALARAHGRSWNQIGIALGVSRQAARQRFAERINA